MVDIARHRHRLAGIVIGFWFIIWVPVEDSNTIVLMSLSLSVSSWLGFRWWLDQAGDFKMRQSLFIGGLSGLGVPLIAFIFIAIKAGLHAHGFTDYVPSQLSGILYSLPYWMLLGLIAGFIAKKVAQ